MKGIRSAVLETRTTRLRLPISRKPVFIRLRAGLNLGYRRNQTAGTWVARFADGKGGSHIKAIGRADDGPELEIGLSAGEKVLTFDQAQDAALAAHAADLAERVPAAPEAITVGQALDRYAADLDKRDGDAENVRRVRIRLSEALLARPVASLARDELRAWRDGLKNFRTGKPLARATINRTATALRAALNFAADGDERITNRRAWQIGAADLPDAEQSRNVILDDATIRQLIAEACEMDSGFGLLVEVAAVTGARVSQLARLESHDLQDGDAPRLLIPASRKGRGAKAVLRRPVPISPSLAARLKSDRLRLLTKADGRPWGKSDQRTPFAQLARRCELDPAEVTLQALRHSSIVRQLLAGVPIRVVATGHDTSLAMIERTYSRHISDQADAMIRGAMLAMDTLR